MKEQKIIVIGPSNIDKRILCNKLQDLNEEFVISDIVTNVEYDDENHISYMDDDTIYKSFQNNAFLFLHKYGEGYFGITNESFYTSNIIFLGIGDFNQIPDKIFNEYEILVIWLDSKNISSNVNLARDINETKFLLERLETLRYMYFLDENVDNISKIILTYLNTSEEEKLQLLEENS